MISLIDRVHKIYEDTLWTDKIDGQGFSGMGFIIKKIVVHRKPTEVRPNEQHYNMKRSSWDVRTLLEVFSREFTHKVSCEKWCKYESCDNDRFLLGFLLGSFIH